MKGDKNFSEVLGKENLRNTRHRNSVLQIMEIFGQPISAEELYLALKGEGISISVSTVYRALDVLVEKGIIIKTDLTDHNKNLYEINHQEHRHHLVCVICNRIMPVEDCPIEGYASMLEKKFDFAITGHKLEMFGHCQKCRGNENKKGAT